MQIKQSVLSACRVRYLRCPVDQLPSVAELQLLVPTNSAAARGPQPAPAPLPAARHRDAATGGTARRAERTALWQDSTVFQDSFFAPESRDGFSNSEFGSTNRPPRSNPRRGVLHRLGEADTVPDALEPPDPEENGGDGDGGGVVIDPPQFSRGSRR
jgi:hypothetical protein